MKLLVAFLCLVGHWPGHADRVRVIERTLTEDDVVKLVLEHNSDIKLELFDYRLAEAECAAGLIDFDYFVSFLPSHSEEVMLPNVTYDRTSYTDRTSALSLGLKRKFWSGTQSEVTFQHLHIVTNSQVATLDDRYTMAAQLKLTQPLLKGWGQDYAAAVYLKAIEKRQRYYWKLRNTVDQKLVAALGLFWDLQRVDIDQQIKNRAVVSMNRRVEQVRSKANLGKADDSEVNEVLSKYYLKSAELRLARSAVSSAAEKLWNEIYPPGMAWPDLNLRAQSRWTATSKERVTDAGLLQRNAKIRMLMQEEKEAQVDLRKAKNARLPQLDLAVQYTSVGLGSQTSVAFDQMDSVKFPGWLVMLNFSLPFGNHSARGEYQRQLVAMTSKELTRAKEVQNLNKRLTSHAQRGQASGEQLISVRERISRTEELVDFKERAHQTGRLTFFEVNKSEDELFDLKMQESQVINDRLKIFAESKMDSGELALEAKKTFFEFHKLPLN